MQKRGSRWKLFCQLLFGLALYALWTNVHCRIKTMLNNIECSGVICMCNMYRGIGAKVGCFIDALHTYMYAHFICNFVDQNLLF